jgi:hypothetical protein
MKDKPFRNDFDFDQLYEAIASPHFAHLDSLDKRRSNKSITVSDACKSGFAIYSLKASSLLDFRPKAPAEDANLRKCFNIGKIPSDSGLKKMLDKVDSQELRGVFSRVLDYLTTYGVLDKYRFHENHLTVSDSQCSLKLLNNGVFTTFRR